MGEVEETQTARDLLRATLVVLDEQLTELLAGLAFQRDTVRVIRVLAFGDDQPSGDAGGQP